jgi:hypothetical protein
MSGPTPLPERRTSAAGPFSSAKAASASSISEAGETSAQKPELKARASAQGQSASDKFVTTSRNPFSSQALYARPLDISGLTLSRPANDTVAVGDSQKRSPDEGAAGGSAGFALAASAGALPAPVGPPSPPVWAPGTAGAAAEGAAGAGKVAAGGSRLVAAGGVAAAAAVLLYPGGIRPDQAHPITSHPWSVVPTWPKPLPDLVEDWRKAGLLDPGKTGLPEFPSLPPGADGMQEYDWTRKLSPEQQAHLKDLYAQVQAGLKPEGANNWKDVRSYIGKPVADGIPKDYVKFECKGHTFLRRKDGNSDKFAQLTVDEKGLIQPGASQRLSQPGALTREINKVTGPPPPHHQDHHVVPDAIVRDHDLFRAARTRGNPPYNLDTFDNGSRLAEEPQYRTSISKDLPIHNGCHPKYNEIARKAADGEMAKLIQQYGELGKVPPERLTEAARNVEQFMRVVLQKWTKTQGDKLF